MDEPDDDVEGEQGADGTWFDAEIHGYKLLKWNGPDTTEKNAVLAATQNRVTLNVVANVVRAQYENDTELARYRRRVLQVPPTGLKRGTPTP